MEGGCCEVLVVEVLSCCCGGKFGAALLILCCCVRTPAGDAVVELLLWCWTLDPLLLCGGAVMFSSEMMMHTTSGLRGPR